MFFLARARLAQFLELGFFQKNLDCRKDKAFKPYSYVSGLKLAFPEAKD